MPNQVLNTLAKTSSEEPQRTGVTSRRRWTARNLNRIAVISFLSVVAIVSLISIQIWMNKRDGTKRSTDPSTTATVEPESKTPEIGIKRYLLDSLTCRVQDVEPFHPDAKLYFENDTSEQCTERCTELYGLTSVSPNRNGTHTLHVHKDRFSQYVNGTPISCCYRKMSANLTSDHMNISKNCRTFKSALLLNETIEYVKVSCSNKPEDNVTLKIYENVHAFVGIKPEVDIKMKAYESDICDVHEEELLHVPKPYVSVMIFGIGSMSRLDFKRNMPKTEKYLNSNEWHPLNVYNRVGENALSNLAALLAGTDLDTLESTCWSNQSVKTDCPWIWKRFSQKGFITAYGEDSPQLDTFSSRVPTDYFLRPFMKAARRIASASSQEEDISDCSGSVHSASHVLNYSLEFAYTFENYLTFSVFWLSTLSRKGLNCAGQWDDTIVSYLTDLEPIRDNALVIFMSDQGENAGGFRQTNMGFYESNLPFIYFSLPRSLPMYDKPDFLKLLNNQNKLTSPFDVYVSLLEVLGEAETAPGCPTCMSVFAELPENRACEDAGIPRRYCACTEYVDISDTAPYEYLGSFVLEEVNKLIETYEIHINPNERCVQHVLKGIKTLRIAASSFRSVVRSIEMNSANDYFMVTVQTTQDAIFEAMVARDNYDVLKIEGGISRMDYYENHSKCMEHPEGKKFCLCDRKPLFNKM